VGVLSNDYYIIEKEKIQYGNLGNCGLSRKKNQKNPQKALTLTAHGVTMKPSKRKGDTYDHTLQCKLFLYAASDV